MLTHSPEAAGIREVSGSMGAEVVLLLSKEPGQGDNIGVDLAVRVAAVGAVWRHGDGSLLRLEGK